MATAQTKIVAQKLKAHAQQLHDRILKIGVFLKKHWVIVGSITDEFKKQELWKYMGCRDFESWRRKVLLGRSTMYSNLRLWNGVKNGIKNKKITMADLEAITAANAEWLCKLPEKERFDKLWIQRAQKMDEEEFQSCVEKALPKDGSSSDVSVAEERVDFKVRCSKGQAEMFEDILTDVQKAHNLKDDRPRALEIVFVEYRNSDEESKMRVLTLLGQNIIHTHDALKRIQEVTHSDKAADEQLAEVIKINAEVAGEIGLLLKKHEEAFTLVAFQPKGKQSKTRTNGHANGKAAPAKGGKPSPLEVVDGGKAAAKPTTVQ
jgi:hypothetical protein